LGLTALAFNLIHLSSTSSSQLFAPSSQMASMKIHTQLTKEKGLSLAFASGPCGTVCSALQPLDQSTACPARNPAPALRLPIAKHKGRIGVLCNANAEADKEGFLLENEYQLGGNCGDVIFCGVEKIPFLRASFGMNDDVSAEIWRADPIHADMAIRNPDKLKGRIALVSRGSSSGNPCSFVEKAVRVGEAGAVGMIVINTQDSLISPGDSARAGTDLEMPVVGVKLSDAEGLVDGQEATMSFQPIATLNSEQRRYLRAVAMIKEQAGELNEVLLDESVKSETLLDSLDTYLSEHELVRVKFGEDDAPVTASLADLEDVVDVSTVLADNLGATVIAINPQQTILYRANPWSPRISVPVDGDLDDLAQSLTESVEDVRSLLTTEGVKLDEDPWASRTTGP